MGFMFTAAIERKPLWLSASFEAAGPEARSQIQTPNSRKKTKSGGTPLKLQARKEKSRPQTRFLNR